MPSLPRQPAHPFEEAGLGKAPFRFGHVADKPSSCQFCGMRIRWQYWIKAEDGSQFYVGSECVKKTGGDASVEGFTKARLSHERALRRARMAAEIPIPEREIESVEERRKRFEADHPGLLQQLKGIAKECMIEGEIAWNNKEKRKAILAWAAGRYWDSCACAILKNGYLLGPEIIKRGIKEYLAKGPEKLGDHAGARLGDIWPTVGRG